MEETFGFVVCDLTGHSVLNTVPMSFSILRRKSIYMADCYFVLHFNCDCLSNVCRNFPQLKSQLHLFTIGCFLSACEVQSEMKLTLFGYFAKTVYLYKQASRRVAEFYTNHQRSFVYKNYWIIQEFSNESIAFEDTLNKLLLYWFLILLLLN